MARISAPSLDKFIGTYRIVWDSRSLQDPRPHSDFGDSLLTLSRPELPPSWPKERSPPASPSSSIPECGLTPTHAAGTSESVVLRITDRGLGTHHTASQILCCLHTPTSSSRPRDSPSPPLTHPFGSASSSSSSPASSRSASPRGRPAKRQVSCWRFDWDQTWRPLGFRYEGMDTTAPRGHSLWLTDLRDDAGHPFLMLELCPAGEHMSSNMEAIKVLAKRQSDRSGGEGLSNAERARLDMRSADD